MRYYRTLVVITQVLEETDQVIFTIPAWGHESVTVSEEFFPENILALVKSGQKYFHAKVTLAAVTQGELEFTHWEES